MYRDALKSSPLLQCCGNNIRDRKREKEEKKTKRKEKKKRDALKSCPLLQCCGNDNATENLRSAVQPGRQIRP